MQRKMQSEPHAMRFNARYGEKLETLATARFIGDQIYFFSKTGNVLWNPLTDDGDALRLAVKLGLSIEILSTSMEPHTRVNGKEEEHRADPYAATRRAIVRSAAEIGKSA